MLGTAFAYLDGFTARGKTCFHAIANLLEFKGSMMKMFSLGLILLASMAMIGCDNVYDREADAVRDVTQEQAEVVREQGEMEAEATRDMTQERAEGVRNQLDMPQRDAALPEIQADRLENQGERAADRIEFNAEQRADAIEDEGEAKADAIEEVNPS